MNIPESFYIALCMTVLLLGVVYWFWSQNQYIQRKINLLENIVYELKELCSNQTSFVGPPAELKTTKYSSPVEPVAYKPMTTDESHSEQEQTNDLHSSLLSEVQDIEEVLPNDFEARTEHKDEVEESPVFFHPIPQTNDDLQPGGVGSGIEEAPAADASNKASVLDSMTLKELKRLADQRNIHYDSKARKPDLIALIRASPVTAFPTGEATISLSA